MNNRNFLYLLSFLSTFLLSGCLGLGGGTSSITETVFADWSSITKTIQVDLEGISTDVSYTANDYNIATLTNKGTDLTTTASVKYETNNTISKISVTTQNGTVTFDEDNGDTIGTTGTTIYGYNESGSDFFLAADPLNSSVNWNYQTFGIWETGRGTGLGTAGGISVGTITTGSNIPASGTATYTGYYGGAFSDRDGDDFLTRGTVSVSTDFGERTLGFQTSGDEFVSPVANTPSWTGDTNQAMSGTLTYTPANNSFTGDVTDGYNNSGAATGRFYGPNAEELGGVFNITGSALYLHAGAFGAKK